jgi:RND family efflux transporter MFP subunit
MSTTGQHNTWWALAALAVGATMATAGGCRRAPVDAKSKQALAALVQVAPAEIRTMIATVSVTGNMEARDDVALSSESSGRVTKVTVREGDRVRQGQAVIVLDQTESLATLEQAQANLEAARARLAQAVTALDVEPTQVDAQIRQAEAALSAARDHLTIVQKGAREQERQQAKNAVAQAKANMDNAQADLKRMEYLLSQKAVSPQSVDAARTQYQVATANYDSAVAQLNLIEEGARPEEIQSAEAQVQQAEEALRAARAGRAQIEVRRREVEAAQAAVAQARASVDYAASQHSQKAIRSPIVGDVYLRNVDPGEVVMSMSGTPLLKIADLGTMYYQAEVSETEIESIAVGQPVAVTIDALQGRRFAGRVATIVPKAAAGSRTFVVKIAVENPSHLILPGMFARGRIAVEKRLDAVVVNKAAVMVRAGRATLFVVKGGRARQQQVDVGITDQHWAEIRSGVSPSDQVVVAGQQDLGDGDRVRVVDADAKARPPAD